LRGSENSDTTGFETRLLLLFTVLFIAIAGLVLLMNIRTDRQLVSNVEETLEKLIA